MTNFKKQFVTVVATSAVLLNLVTPLAFADTSITVSGNGASSDNTATVKNTTSNTVLQSNVANVSNTVNAKADTGNNEANKNTNGDVKIYTGDATVHSTVENTLNSNVADVNCGCDAGDTTVKVDGNGAYSDNDVKLKNKTENQVTQDNVANVSNYVDAKAKTGDNEADKNTGGDVKVYTGDASVTANVSTLANANVAQIGGNGGQGGDVSAVISGNGADSDNDVNLKFKSKNDIWQTNDANISNTVDASAKTGYNEADKNTGGNTGVWSGDAEAWAGVDNSVNFNSAAIDCGCVEDVTAKVAGNGYDSDNNLKAKFNSDNGVFQGGGEYGNNANLSNDVNPEAKSGKNEADKNTGPVLDDPVWVFSGDAFAGDSVSNTGNVNSYGDPFQLPEGFDLGGTHFHFNFSFGN